MVIRDTDFHLKERAEHRSRANDAAVLVASPWDRLAAVVIDLGIILFPFALLVTAPFQRMMKEGRLYENYLQFYAAQALVYFVSIILVICFQVVFTFLFHGTPGKLLLGLRIRPLWATEKLTLHRAFIRSITWTFSVLLLGIPFLGVFAHFLRRPFHDRLADTVVVSIRPERQSSSPSLTESAFVRGIHWALIVIVLMVSFIFVREQISDLVTKKELISALEESDVLCGAVSEALGEWPMENSNEGETRLDAAMSLFGAGKINLECLESEVERLYTVEDKSALLYLTRAFVYSDQDEVADKYLNQVCEEYPKSEECLLSDILSEKKSEMSSADLEQIKKSKNIYGKIWLLREFIRSEKYQEAIEISDSIPPMKEFASFVVAARTRSEWAIGRRLESLGAEQVAYSILDPDEGARLSGFMCYEQIWNDCEKLSSVSCNSFSRYTKEYDDVLNDPRASLAYLRKFECESKGSPDYDALLEKPMNDEVKRLVLVLRENGTDGFMELQNEEEQSKIVEAETDRRMVLRAQSESLLKTLKEDWGEGEKNLNWRKVGITLMERFRDREDWGSVASIAQTLYDYSQKYQKAFVEEEVLSGLVVASYNTGQHQRAEKLLREYLRSYPLKFKSEAREIASVKKNNESKNKIHKELYEIARKLMPGEVE